MKILYILDSYPQISETYVKVEIETLVPDYDLLIVGLKEADMPYENPQSFYTVRNFEEIYKLAKKFIPDVIHTHWLYDQLWLVRKLANRLNIPYTIRSHSFDTRINIYPWYKRIIGKRVSKKNKKLVKIVNDPRCLGVLAFPYTFPTLKKAGIKKNKLIETGPVFNLKLFHNKEPNGHAIINYGGCLPKKKFEDFINLASICPQLTFNLYSMGYLTQKLAELNKKQGSPVNFCQPIEHHEFAKILKNHRWIVYTADPKLTTVGWPIALVEAQAAGVGVCMRRLRPDLDDYLGGAAILYDSVEELTDIISKPVPHSMREKGFLNAQRFDIKDSIQVLTELWERR